MAQDPPETLETLRARVERCAREGDAQGVLRGLVDAWAICRHPALAEAIGMQAPRLHPVPPRLATNQDWQSLVKMRDPCTVDALLAAPWTYLRPLTVRRRLIALARLPPDPRVAAFAAEVAQTLGIYQEAVRIEAERVQQIHGHPDPELGRAPPEPALQALIDAARLGRVQEAEDLLAAVLADPEDDEPRHVYADYLMERGDPLGDYIASSLDPSTPPMELHPTEHLAWCRRLLGPIESHPIELRRGFPYRLYIHARLPRGLLQWATLQEVIWQFPPPDILQLIPELSRARWLKSVHLLDWTDARPSWMEDALTLLQGMGLRELGLCLASWEGASFEPGRWPLLERLELWMLRPGVRLDEPWLGELGRRPIEIGLRSWYVKMGQLVDCALKASRDCAPGVQRLRVSSLAAEYGGIEVTLERQTAFRQLTLGPVYPTNVGVLWRLVTLVTPEVVDSLVVETPYWEDRRFSGRIRQGLKRLLERGLSLQIVPPAPRPRTP